MQREQRIEKLAEIKAKEKPIGTKKIHTSNGMEKFDVWKIPLDYLILNKENGRINSRVKSWEAISGETLNAEIKEHENMLISWIKEAHKSENAKTTESLKRGQLIAGEVTADGVIVGGNRRASLLRSIEHNFLEAVILDEKVGDDHIGLLRLEKSLQHGVDAQVDYNPIEKYLEITTVVDEFGGVERLDERDIMDQIKTMMPRYKSKADIEKDLNIKKQMDIYLEQIGAQGNYEALDEKEGFFVDFVPALDSYEPNTDKWAGWQYKKKDLATLTQRIHTVTRSQYQGGDDESKAYRALFKRRQKGVNNIFGTKRAWDAFNTYWAEAIAPIEAKMKTLDQIKMENPDNPLEAFKNHERDIRKELKGPMEGVFKRSKEVLIRIEKENEPEKLLNSALETLKDLHQLVEDGVFPPQEFDETLYANADDCRKMSEQIKNAFPSR